MPIINLCNCTERSVMTEQLMIVLGLVAAKLAAPAAANLNLFVHQHINCTLGKKKKPYEPAVTSVPPARSTSFALSDHSGGRLLPADRSCRVSHDAITQRRTRLSGCRLPDFLPSGPFFFVWSKKLAATGRVVWLVASRSLPMPGVAPLSAPPGNPDGDVLARWPRG